METADMYISGVGSYVPATVGVDDAVAAGRYTAEEVELHGLVSVAVAGDVPAPEMALRAARTAVARSGRSPTELDLLLYTSTWHQGPEGWPPQSYVQRHLVGDGVLSTQLKQGCNGMFTALELAASYLRGGHRAALLVTADNYGTPLVDRWRMLPGAVAGDAASAVVLDTEAGFARLASVCTASVSQAEEMHRCAEPLFPPGVTEGRTVDFAAHNDVFRRRAVVEGEGTGVLVTLDERMAEVIDQSLSEAGIKAGDVTRVACMNTSQEIADQICEHRLGIPASRSTWEFGRTLGHCGASDQIVALEHLVRGGELGPGDHLLMFAYGPGVTISAAVVEILESPVWSRTRGGDA
ncbi:ketoacyl-ACP synthase III family protein [Actinoallomurus sp. CA-142502]|uniref:ketoacyl-ACP synthase III family protein n=1 Tax=Actinoallomurus sp. CA-142502 TaxID=3239885 RepID=UPI003D908B32